jgi:tRNA pseudouridine55 synthase
MDVSQTNGVIVLDKPPDISSARVVAKVKSVLKARKVGHTGTLDPMATGVLVCCVNQATRIAQFLIHGKKRYCATLRLGIETDTQDATGKVISDTGPISVNAERIGSVISRFEGTYLQSPPAYSALKMKGIPLYRYARAGRPVHKPARRVMIDTIEILAIAPPLVRFVVTCSSGTYVRTLCADIGRELGCGGHLEALRRTGNGRFTTDDALTVPELEALAAKDQVAERMVSMADALSDIPEATANKALTLQIKHGRVIHARDINGLPLNGADGSQKTQVYLKLLDAQRNLLAVVQHHRQSDKLSYVCVFSDHID